LSHVAVTTMADALDTARGPVIFSHSSARALCDHPRNVPDEILARLPDNGGVCMATFVPAFVSQACRDWELAVAEDMAGQGLDYRGPVGGRAVRPEFLAAHPRPSASLADVADHVEHIREVAGVAHVGLGGDYDGVDHLPEGLADVSRYPALIAELRERGWSEAECGALSGGNILRVLRDAEQAAAQISAEHGPSAARIEDLDAAGSQAQPAVPR
jgi:membrane dipeptidase